MHGNTESTSNGYKTRRFDNIRSEIEQSFDIHAAAGTRLGGVHLELTGENVTECTGGARGLTDGDLARAYKSTVDPRLAIGWRRHAPTQRHLRVHFEEDRTTPGSQ